MRCLMIKEEKGKKEKGPRPLRESLAKAVTLTLLIFWSLGGCEPKVERKERRVGGLVVLM